MDEESSFLTTFNTPFGRFRWLRLPFGIKVSSEIFQKHLNQVLEGLVGVVCIADDIVVYGCGETMEEAQCDHDNNLANLLKRCKEKNVKLSYEKSMFNRTEIPFMGHLITSEGLKPDPVKIDAVAKMAKPTDVKSIQRFIGFVTYLSRFLPDLSDRLEPLRQLVKTNQAWNQTHDEIFEDVKRLVTSSPVLAYYNPKEDLVIQCDSSGTGVGAALMQNDQPIAYASRASADAETRYAPIEKEMLAVVYSLERFHQYTYGRHTVVYSDHKPLEMILKKPLIKAPKRLQNMILRVQKYDFTLFYKPGKTMHLADTLSRAHNTDDKDPIMDQADVNVVTYLPMSEERLSEIKRETACDKTLQLLMITIANGWPQECSKLPESLMPYWSYRDELAVHDSLIFKGHQVVIPLMLREDMKARIHSAHLGVDGCLRRARLSCFWPRMTSDLKQYILACDICRTYGTCQQKEPLHPHEEVTRPWEKVGSDLFTLEGRTYLITVDYYSNFWEIDYLPTSTSAAVINKTKAHFARYGSPNVLVSDNGPQYVSESFERFAKVWDFEHRTISPRHSKSNGKVESAVKTAKRLLRKSMDAKTDQYMALLDHRNTPTQGLTSSPVQRFMSRRTRTMIPTTAELLEPRVVKEMDQQQSRVKKQMRYYNVGAKSLSPLKVGDVVRMRPHQLGDNKWKKAIVKERLDFRSYQIDVNGQLYRRNRVDLRKTEETPDNTRNVYWPRSSTKKASDRREIQERQELAKQNLNDDLKANTARSNVEVSGTEYYRTRSGRQVKPPQRLDL